jgi:putative FmdB family regulatory protein
MQHFPPAGRIEKRDPNRVLYKSRNARSLPGRNQRPNFPKLFACQRNRNLRGRHTKYHTSRRGCGGAPVSDTISSITPMPIYEYECRDCGHQFELLVLAHTVAACPECRSRELEQLLSGFAVSSDAIRKAHVQAARRKMAASKDVRDRKVAEAEEFREHHPEAAERPKPKK